MNVYESRLTKLFLGFYFFHSLEQLKKNGSVRYKILKLKFQQVEQFTFPIYSFHYHYFYHY